MMKLHRLLRRKYWDRERALEVESHLQHEIDDNLARGMTPEEARRHAYLKFGNPTRIREEIRQMNSLPILESIWRDVRYALRQMKKSPGFAATVVLTLALGIGAAAAMFTVVDHVLLQPVPYTSPGQLVQVTEVDQAGGRAWPLPWLDIEQWRKQGQAFEGIAFSSGPPWRTFLERDHTAVPVGAERVSANLLPLLGVRPMLGRGFLPLAPSYGPDKNAGTVVLGYGAWRAMGGSRQILGKEVRINEQPMTVVGVMPPGFRYPANRHGMVEAWMPEELGKHDKARNDSATSYEVIGRLKPGASMAQARSELGALQKRLGAKWEYALGKDHSRVKIVPYADGLVGAKVRKALLVLFAAAGMLWLIACLNAMNLLLARGMTRQREMAMRRALGAGRWRIARQMLVEGLVLGAAAGALGMGLAAASVRLLGHELRSQLPLPVPAWPDGWILAALLGMTLASVLVVAAWPAWMAARTPVEPALKQGGMQTGQNRRHHRVRGTLVALEIAVSLVLLMGCGLLLRTIYDLRQVPLGYRTDHILVANLNVPAYRYAKRNMTTELYEPLLQRVQHLHGVESAGLMTNVPLGDTFRMNLRMYSNGRALTATMKAATPGVEKVFDLPMAAGRFFDANDTPTSQQVMVVNEAFARKFSPNVHDPAAILGMKLMGTERRAKNADYAQIVGVMKDFHQVGIEDPSMPEVEVPLMQTTPKSIFYNVLDEIAMDLAVRTRLPKSVMVPELRNVLRQASPELAGAKITTMDEIVADSYGNQLLAAHLLEVFGGVALLLCVAGLYGLLAYVVSQRMRDLAVRVALGARRGDLIWMVMRQAGAMLAVGIAVGCALAWASATAVRGFLYGVQAHNGWILAAASLLMLASGLMAAYLPARRAAAVDPMRVLRME